MGLRSCIRHQVRCLGPNGRHHMDLFVIRKYAGAITLQEWRRVIEGASYLEQASDRTGVNPFTQQPITFSGEGRAHFLTDGRRTGNIALRQGQLLTTGVPKSICAEIALKLGANVFLDADRPQD